MSINSMKSLTHRTHSICDYNSKQAKHSKQTFWFRTIYAINAKDKINRTNNWQIKNKINNFCAVFGIHCRVVVFIRVMNHRHTHKKTTTSDKKKEYRTRIAILNHRVIFNKNFKINHMLVCMLLWLYLNYT